MSVIEAPVGPLHILENPMAHAGIMAAMQGHSINIGDVVYLSQDAGDAVGFLHAEGFQQPCRVGVLRCGRDGKGDPAQFRECLFEVVPKQSYVARDTWRRSEQERRKLEADLHQHQRGGAAGVLHRETSTKMSFLQLTNLQTVAAAARLKRAKEKLVSMTTTCEEALLRYDRERERNANAARQLDKPIKNGEVVQLLHLKSGKYLTLVPSEEAMLDHRECFKVTLSDIEPDDRCALKFEHGADAVRAGSAAFGSQVDEVSAGDVINVLEVSGHSQTHLHVSELPDGFEEVNLNVAPSPWRIHLYRPREYASPPADLPTSMHTPLGHGLHFGSVLRIHSEITQSSLAAATAGGKPPYLQPDQRGSAKQIFILESSRFDEGGCVCWGDEVRLRHLPSGMLVAVHPKGAGDEVMGASHAAECNCALVGGKSMWDQERSTFHLMPADGGGRSGTPISQAHTRVRLEWRKGKQKADKGSLWLSAAQPQSGPGIVDSAKRTLADASERMRTPGLALRWKSAPAATSSFTLVGVSATELYDVDRVLSWRQTAAAFAQPAAVEALVLRSTSPAAASPSDGLGGSQMLQHHGEPALKEFAHAVMATLFVPDDKSLADTFFDGVSLSASFDHGASVASQQRRVRELKLVDALLDLYLALVARLRRGYGETASQSLKRCSRAVLHMLVFTFLNNRRNQLYICSADKCENAGAFLNTLFESDPCYEHMGRTGCLSHLVQGNTALIERFVLGGKDILVRLMQKLAGKGMQHKYLRCVRAFLSGKGESKRSVQEALLSLMSNREYRDRIFVELCGVAHDQIPSTAMKWRHMRTEAGLRDDSRQENAQGSKRDSLQLFVSWESWSGEQWLPDEGFYFSAEALGLPCERGLKISRDHVTCRSEMQNYTARRTTRQWVALSSFNKQPQLRSFNRPKLRSRRDAFLEYFAVLINMLADMCSDRCYKAAKFFGGKILSPQLCIAAINDEHLPPAIRAAFAHFTLHCYIQLFPHHVERLPRFGHRLQGLETLHVVRKKATAGYYATTLVDTDAAPAEGTLQSVGGRMDTNLGACKACIRKLQGFRDAWKGKTLAFLDGKYVMVLLVVMVLFSLSLLICEFVDEALLSDKWKTAGVSVTCIFIAEVVTRIWAMGPAHYFRDKFCCLDFVVSIIDIVGLALDSSQAQGSKGLRALRIARFVRIFRLARFANAQLSDEPGHKCWYTWEHDVITAKHDEVNEEENPGATTRAQSSRLFRTMSVSGRIASMSKRIIRRDQSRRATIDGCRQEIMDELNVRSIDVFALELACVDSLFQLRGCLVSGAPRGKVDLIMRLLQLSCAMLEGRRAFRSLQSKRDVSRVILEILGSAPPRDHISTKVKKGLIWKSPTKHRHRDSALKAKSVVKQGDLDAELSDVIRSSGRNSSGRSGHNRRRSPSPAGTTTVLRRTPPRQSKGGAEHKRAKELWAIVRQKYKVLVPSLQQHRAVRRVSRSTVMLSQSTKHRGGVDLSSCGQRQITEGKKMCWWFLQRVRAEHTELQMKHALSLVKDACSDEGKQPWKDGNARPHLSRLLSWRDDAGELGFHSASDGVPKKVFSFSTAQVQKQRRLSDMVNRMQSDFAPPLAAQRVSLDESSSSPAVSVSGTRIVDWLLENGRANSRESAMVLGQRLLEFRFLRDHDDKGYPFGDNACVFDIGSGKAKATESPAVDDYEPRPAAGLVNKLIQASRLRCTMMYDSFGKLRRLPKQDVKAMVLGGLDSRFGVIVLFICVVGALTLTFLDLNGTILLADEPYYSASKTTTVIFIVEVSLRMWSMGGKAFITDWFCAMDLLVTVLDVVTVVLELATGGEGGGGEAKTGTMFRALRILRILRVLRVLRLARYANKALELREAALYSDSHLNMSAMKRLLEIVSNIKGRSTESDRDRHHNRIAEALDLHTFCKGGIVALSVELLVHEDDDLFAAGFQMAQQPVTRRTLVQCLNKAHISRDESIAETLCAKMNELECQIELANAQLKMHYAALSFTVSAGAFGEVLRELANHCVTAPQLPDYNAQEILRTEGIFDHLAAVVNIRSRAWLALHESESTAHADGGSGQKPRRANILHWLQLSIVSQIEDEDASEEDCKDTDEIKDDSAFDEALEPTGTDTGRMRIVLRNLDTAITSLMLNLVLMNRANQWALARHMELIVSQVYHGMDGLLQVLSALFTANPLLSDAMKKPMLWQIVQLTEAARQDPSRFPQKTAVQCMELLQVMVVPPRIFEAQHFSAMQLGVPNFLMQAMVLQALQSPCFQHLQSHVGTRFDMAKVVSACQSAATAEQRDELDFHERLVELLACLSAGRVGSVEAACTQLIPLNRTLTVLRNKKIQCRPSLLRAYCLFLAEVYFDTELQPTGWHALVADTRAWKLLSFCAENWLEQSSPFTQWPAPRQAFVIEGVLPMLTSFFTFVWDSASELNGEMMKTFVALESCILQLVDSGKRRADVAAFTTAKAMKLRLSPSLEARLVNSVAAVQEQEELEHDFLREIQSPADDVLRELTYSIEQSSNFREREERSFDGFVQNLLDSGKGGNGKPAETNSEQRAEAKYDSDKNTVRLKVAPNFDQICARMIAFMRSRLVSAAKGNERGTEGAACGADNVNRTELGVAVLRTLCRCITIAHPLQSDMRAVEKGELPPYNHDATPHTSSDAMLKFKQMQVKLVQHSAAEMVVEIVAHCPNDAIVDAALHMGTVLVYGGNSITQRRFEYVFRHADSSAPFFAQVQRRLRQRDAEVVASFRQGMFVAGGDREWQERRTAERHMMLFLQNLCEGHFEQLQLMLLSQPFNIESHNLLVDCVNLLCAHVPAVPGVLKRMRPDQAMNIVLVLTLLVESVEGPCSACQNTIVETGSALEALSRLITNDLGLLSETDLLLAQKVKLMAMKMLVSLLEGQYTDGRLHNLVGDVVPPIMLKRKIEDNYRLWPEWMRLYRPEPSIILGDEPNQLETELVVVLGEEARDLNALASLLSAKDESYKKGGLAPVVAKIDDQSSISLGAAGDGSRALQVAPGKGVAPHAPGANTKIGRMPDHDADFEQRYAKAFLFFNGERLSAAQPKIHTVEFVWSGHLETALYIRPRLCQQLTPDAMSTLLQQINFTPGTQVRDFMLLVKRMHREMVHRDRLTRKMTCGMPVAKFMVTHLKTIRKLVLTLSLTINCFVLIATRLGGNAGEQDGCMGGIGLATPIMGAEPYFFLGSAFLPKNESSHTQDDICLASWGTDTLIKSIAGLQLFFAVLTVTVMAFERFPVEMELHDALGSQRGNVFASIVKFPGHKALTKSNVVRQLRAIARDLTEVFLSSAGLFVVVGCFTAVVKIIQGTVSQWILGFACALLLAIMPARIRHLIRKLKAKGAISSGGWVTMYCIVFDTLEHKHLWFYVLYCCTTVAGIVFSPFFYSLQLFEIVLVSSTLQNVVKAITSSAPQLGMAALLALVMIYMFASYGFFFVPYNLRNNEGNFIFQNGESVQSIAECFLDLVHHALVESGGTLTEDAAAGERTSSRTRRFLYDVAFFVVFIVLLLNMIFGIIIDKFGSLRDAQLARQAQQQNYCFICGIPKQKFDTEGLKHGMHAAFDHHVKSEHSIRNYFDLFIYLLEKDPANYTGADTYLRDCLDKQKLDWVPLGRSLTLDRFNEMEARKGDKTLALGSVGTHDGTNNDNDGDAAQKQQGAATANPEVEGRARLRSGDSASSPLASPMTTPQPRKRSLGRKISTANVAEGLQQGLQLHVQQQGMERQLESMRRMQSEQKEQRKLLQQCMRRQQKQEETLEKILQLLTAQPHRQNRDGGVDGEVGGQPADRNSDGSNESEEGASDSESGSEGAE